MKKKKQKTSENYLERIPKRPEHIKWSADEKGIVTLDIENKGVFNRVAQKLLHLSLIHIFFYLQEDLLKRLSEKMKV